MSWIDETLQPNGTMINKLAITDSTELAEIERLIVSAKYVSIPDYRIESIDTLKKIHFWLFSDLYSWAGKFRTGDFQKGNTVFFPRERFYIAISDLNNQISEIVNSRAISKDDLAIESAGLLLDINNFHPFREGNGRTQRLFIQLLIRQMGFNFDLSRGSLNYKIYMDASINDDKKKMATMIYSGMSEL
ncbi:Fic/DOC family protein [Companilactobacillus sp.]|jgi:cell filamentation protein|uniref:Fic/DOC family protein n=1 Tax=Companilactobacillus sp. TaxID=2767905 RepID=UPI0025C65A21|nr:Fic family protein [Companilactobacillus sp.]MCH4009399.1 Fic family protein [Companilactobacillus sp.]MCH4050422.1 Fic family protein [Companilactobacillus sp.]MCH4077341.1 Fic family protein [Companilactobacillus sp.]MCH4125917.1 Fic family protein [Companilactobacillus sp.]MCI1311626.1 Fic family protein [Companilactobacillus sp.]